MGTNLFEVISDSGLGNFVLDVLTLAMYKSLPSCDGKRIHIYFEGEESTVIKFFTLLERTFYPKCVQYIQGDPISESTFLLLITGTPNMELGRDHVIFSGGPINFVEGKQEYNDLCIVKIDSDCTFDTWNDHKMRSEVNLNYDWVRSGPEYAIANYLIKRLHPATMSYENFIADRCNVGETISQSVADVYDDYLVWAKDCTKGKITPDELSVFTDTLGRFFPIKDGRFLGINLMPSSFKIE